MTILKTLNWQVHPPTSICFLRQFMRLLPSSISLVARYKIAEVTRFVSEISVCLYKFVDAPASAVAYAGMLIAMDRIEDHILPSWQRQQIFHAMATLCNMDFMSLDIQKTVARLRTSLEKNVSLQDLMITIDAQCRAEGYMFSPCSSPSGSSTGDKCGSKRPIPGFHSSPRDVTATPRRA